MAGNDEGHYLVSNLSARQRLLFLSGAQQQVEQVARFGVERPHACVDDPVRHRLKCLGEPRPSPGTIRVAMERNWLGDKGVRKKPSGA